MRKPHGNVELIEVFAPDDAALWADAAPPSVEPIDSSTEQRPSHRGVVLVGLLVVGIGVGAVALSDDDQSQTAPTTTVAVTPSTVRVPLDPTDLHYVIQDSAIERFTLTAYSADLVTPPPANEQVHVFTDGTAVGPIVRIELHAHPFEGYGIVGATRDVVDGVELVRPITQPDTVISEVAIDGAWSATIRATRFSAAKVMQLINGLRVVDGQLTHDVDLMGRLGLGLTFEANSFDSLIFGYVESEVRYLTAGGEIVTLRSALGEHNRRLAGFLYLVDGAQRALDGRAYGQLDNGDGIVVWEDEGILLSLVAPGDPDDLIALSQQVRAATRSEWSAMLYGLRPDYTLGEFATLAIGDASEAWRAGPQIAQRKGRTEFLWWWTVPGTDNVTASTAAADGVGAEPHFDTVVVPGATFVFVSQPDAGGTATVRAADGTEYVAELRQPFTQSPVYMAVVRIETPGPVTVNINGESVHA